MELRKQWPSLEEAKHIDLVDYLLKLGFQPAKVRQFDYWYLSPLRQEKTASFKVNRKLNLWYDHGIGKGGNIIDFAILYNNCTIDEFLLQLASNLSFQKPFTHYPEQANCDTKSKINIIRESVLSSSSLLHYLKQRKISIGLADRYCREVKYEINGKEYFAIGFKNNSGGYELRNPFFKGSCSPKDITTFNNQREEAMVFEGFFDFLSFMVIQKKQPEIKSDFVILNSTSFFEKARPFMEQHSAIKLYLDRDSTGQNYNRYALSLSNKYKDESGMYQHHKDLNDWLVNFGKSQRKSFKQRL